jgi:hypothetical protein
MFLKKGNQILFGGETEIIEKIPKGNWIILADENQKNFRLEKQPDFTIPKKIYGKETEVFHKVLKSFNKYKKSLGVLLSGNKGSGKTLSAKRIAVESKLPTLILTQPFTGEHFLNFLSAINQPVVMYVDEFEKVYNTHELQEMFLPILGGAFQSSKLWLFTSNSTFLNEFLISRPERIKYHIRFKNLSDDTKEEVIEDLLEDKSQLDSLMDLLDMIGGISIDSLINIIEEMNLVEEDAYTVIRDLNVEIEDTDFNVLMYVDGKRHTSTIHYNPITANTIYISYKDEDGRHHWYSKEKEYFTIDINGGEYTFHDGEGNKFIFTRYEPFVFNPLDN